MKSLENQSEDVIKDLFTVGAHIGYSKSRRHPSMKEFVYSVKDGVEIIDLTLTKQKIKEASDFLSDLAEKQKSILLLGGKSTARDAVKSTGESLGLPYVAGRWIGGTLTNFSQIRRQVDKLQSLRESREKGELEKYTKREQLSFDRDIADLERFYSGLIPLSTGTPGVLVVVDPDQESIAVKEAIYNDVPIVAIANTDCNVSDVDYLVPANDNSKATVDYIFSIFSKAITAGQKRSKADSSVDEASKDKEESRMAKVA